MAVELAGTITTLVLLLIAQGTHRAAVLRPRARLGGAVLRRRAWPSHASWSAGCERRRRRRRGARGRRRARRRCPASACWYAATSTTACTSPAPASVVGPVPARRRGGDRGGARLQAGIKSIIVALLLIVLNTVLVHATARAGRIRDTGRWALEPHEKATIPDRDRPADRRARAGGRRRARGRGRPRPAAPGLRGQLLRPAPRRALLRLRGARRGALETSSSARSRCRRSSCSPSPRSATRTRERRRGGRPAPRQRDLLRHAAAPVPRLRRRSGRPAAGRWPGCRTSATTTASTGCCSTASRCPSEHATNVITAVNFDYRGFDTLGEEFILFAAVLGLALLLRERRDEEEGPPDDDAVGRQVTGALGGGAADTVTPGGPDRAAGRSTSSPTAPSRPAAASRAASSRPRRCCSSTWAASTWRCGACGPTALVEIAKATGAAGLRAHRHRRADLRRRLPRQLPAQGTPASSSRPGRCSCSAWPSASRSPAGSCCCSPSSSTRRSCCGAGAERAAHELPPVRGRDLDLPGRALRDRHQPPPDPPGHLPVGGAVLDLRAAAGGRLPHRRRRPRSSSTSRWARRPSTRWCRR